MLYSRSKLTLQLQLKYKILFDFYINGKFIINCIIIIIMIQKIL